MLRAPLLRSSQLAARAASRRATAQWLPQRQWASLQQRSFADVKKPDPIVLPGTQSSTVARDEVANPPTLTSPANPSIADNTISATNVPLTPPAPAIEQNLAAGASTTGASTTGTNPTVPPTTVPTGTGTASVAPPPGSTGTTSPPPPPPAAKRRPRRIRNLFYTLLFLTVLTYTGGTYYALENDNFHDFFAEYVPFGEDIIGYIEERKFRERFPARIEETKLYPQTRGEGKVTIPGRGGVQPKVAAEGDADLGSKGRHVSALEDNKPKATPQTAKESVADPAQKKPAEKSEKPRDSQTLLPQDPKTAAQPSVKDAAPKEQVKPAPAQPAATPAPHIETLDVPNNQEPVVADAVKMLNDLITVINADNAAGNYSSAITKAKEDLSKVIKDVSTMKSLATKEKEDAVKNLHGEFDNAAKELVKRLEGEMAEQERKWRDEYEEERERLSQSYQSKLRSELDAADKVYNQKLKNELLEQQIGLQRQFTDSVRNRVEEERQGRLSKLKELSSEVEELEKLTSDWNNIVDGNLKTQHLLVAVEAVKAKLEKAERPIPFTDELVALKEIAPDDGVINAAIASIPPQAYQRGLPSPAQLVDRFRRVAHEVRKAALLPENAGVTSHLASRVLSGMMFKKEGMAIGDDVESVLARTEALLEEGDLDRAAREMNGLNGWAKVLSRDWLSECRRVLETKQALDVIASEARLQSLLAD